MEKNVHTFHSLCAVQHKNVSFKMRVDPLFITLLVLCFYKLRPLKGKQKWRTISTYSHFTQKTELSRRMNFDLDFPCCHPTQWRVWLNCPSGYNIPFFSIE